MPSHRLPTLGSTEITAKLMNNVFRLEQMTVPPVTLSKGPNYPACMQMSHTFPREESFRVNTGTLTELNTEQLFISKTMTFSLS